MAQWLELFIQPCFISVVCINLVGCIQIFILHSYFRNRKVVIELNGLFWGLSNWFENSISICHQVFYVWWLEYGLLAKEFINHFIQALFKVMKKLFIISFLDDHGLVFLILSNAHHEIKYFFEITCNDSPFILTCGTIPHMH